MSTTGTITYGAERIPYAVEADPRRTSRVAIHVDPDGTVKVDAPPGFSDKAVHSAVQKRARWVVDHVSQARNRFRHVHPRDYVSGEQVLYLGRRYLLKVLKDWDGGPEVRLRGNRLEVGVMRPDRERVRRLVWSWYREKANDYFGRRLEALSGRLTWVTAPPAFQLREMRRQWGSCSPQGRLILNPHLVKAPRDCVDYVLVHELAHLKHHDHSRGFWRLVDAHDPDWPSKKRMLDDMAEILVQQ